MKQYTKIAIGVFITRVFGGLGGEPMILDLSGLCDLTNSTRHTPAQVSRGPPFHTYHALPPSQKRIVWEGL